MQTRLTIQDVHYGQENPQDLTFDILQILLHHLKLDHPAHYTTGASNQEEHGQTAMSRKHGR